MNDDVTDDVLILLVDILAACERVLARADPHDARLARIRALGAQLENAVLEHWADLAARALDDDRQLDLDDLLVGYFPHDDDIPF
jgi:hypothetical protein